MIKTIAFILLCAQLSYSMQDSHGELDSFYNHEIVPQLRSYAKLEPENGIELCKHLAQALILVPNFSYSAAWRYKDLIKWVIQNKDNINVQIDITIAKRFIAETLIQADKEGVNQREGASKSMALASIARGIADNADSLRWLVTGDDDSCVSDQAIEARWYKFLATAYPQRILNKE